MKYAVLRSFLFCFWIILLSSCGAYKYTILFKTEKDTESPKVQQLIKEAQGNYVLSKYDKITIEVFTNKGERITDPNGEFPGDPGRQAINLNTQPGVIGAGGAGGLGITQQQTQNGTQFTPLRRFQIQDDGNAYIPLLGAVPLEGLKQYQVDSLLAKAYSQFYEEAFVTTQIINRRVIVLGALGNRVLNLDIDNLNLIEVIARVGNMDARVRADKIKLIRYVDNKPQMHVIDLSTWQGLQAANLRVEPNDIIYLEPRRGNVRREDLQNISSVVGIVGSLLGIITSSITTILLIRSLDR